MEQLFNDIQQHIAQNLPDLTLIDEDCGQLESNEDTYPVTFPCVLIGTPDVDWETLSGNRQQGRCTLTTRLAIDCYDDTHYGSGTEARIAERLRMASALHQLLQGQKPEGAAGPLVRKKSRNYSLSGGIKVYETTYEVRVME